MDAIVQSAVRVDTRPGTTEVKYRADIDGLRAVAVLSVLLHHLNPSVLPGGFVGVDIFFVISGFLITSQVYKEAREGRFSLKPFYKRRINRIVPALLTVIAATLAIGALLLSPADFTRLARSAVSATMGFSNVFFWREYGNYFGGNASEAPLLHTWSLGVEEQFYVLWPLMILLLFKFSGRRIFGVLAVLTLGAVAVSQMGTGIVASASYYLLPTRFFELMIGGVLATALAHQDPGSRHHSGVCAVAGFALIGYSLIQLNRASTFPGVNAVWPCLGSALLIWAGNNPRAWSAKVLSVRPMVFVGLISYSLYLWHWPFIAYLHYTGIEIGPVVGAGVAAIAILSAWLSWKFVEVPMRTTGAPLRFSRVFVRRFAFPVLVLVSIGIATVYTDGFPQRFDPRVAALEKSLAARPDVLRRGCHVPTAMYDTPPSSECRLGAPKDHLDGILIGDSFANHFTGMVDVMAKAEGVSLMDYTMDGCPPILGYDTENKIPAYVERCRLRNEAAYALISKSHYDRVILAGSWPTTPEAGEKLKASIEFVLGTGAALTLILNNQSIEGAATCSIRRIMYGTKGRCVGRRQAPPRYFSDIQSSYPQVHFVDPNQVICAGDECTPVLNDTLLYRDTGHLNDVGSRLLGQSLMRKGVRLTTAE